MLLLHKNLKHVVKYVNKETYIHPARYLDLQSIDQTITIIVW